MPEETVILSTGHILKQREVTPRRNLAAVRGVNGILCTSSLKGGE